MRDATLIQPLGSDGDPVTDSLIVDRDTMVKRRDVLCSGGAAAFATLVSSLLIGSRQAKRLLRAAPVGCVSVSGIRD